jgi:hypothetical protein
MKPIGGAPQVTPIPPPKSLFPGITGGLGSSTGSELGADLGKGLHDIASGLDVNKIFQSITEANKRFTDEGAAAITEQFGASGLRYGSDLMRNLVDYRLQSQKDLQAQLGKLSFEGEALKMGGLQMLQELATSFAPSAVVTQGPAGASPFSQIASAGEAAALMWLAATA